MGCRWARGGWGAYSLICLLFTYRLINADLFQYQQVTVVAHLIREEPRDGKKVSYYLDDGTAFLWAWRTFPGEGASYDPKDYLLAVPDEACYVRIIGTLTRIKDNPVPSITVHGIRRVTDGNEIIHHFMECMLCKMAAQRGWPVRTVSLKP